MIQSIRISRAEYRILDIGRGLQWCDLKDVRIEQQPPDRLEKVTLQELKFLELVRHGGTEFDTLRFHDGQPASGEVEKVIDGQRAIIKYRFTP